MSALLYLVGVVALSALGTTALVLRNRQPRSIDAGVKAFSREMRALSPESRRVVAPRPSPEAPRPSRGRPGR